MVFSNNCQLRRLKHILHAMDVMGHRDPQTCIKVYASLLQECIRVNSLAEGRLLHSHMVTDGLNLNMYLGNTLINLYGKFGSVLNAHRVFDVMPKHNVISWTAIITAYAKQGHPKEAIQLFKQMQKEAVVPDKFVFVAVLQACTSLANLEYGKKIHNDIINDNSESDVFVGSCLVDMYANCGSLDDACQVFSRISERNVVSWNILISGYAQQGHSKEALTLYKNMQQENVNPNKVTFLSVLKACASLEDLASGKYIHAHILECGFDSDIFVRTTLVDMYAKCSSIENAHQVFIKMHERNVVSWNAIISGYARQRSNKEVLNLFEQMQHEGVKPNNATFVCILKVCSSLADLNHGKQVHAHILENSFETDAFVDTALVSMYAKCGGIEYAEQVFNKMSNRSVVCWNIMIAGYAEQGYNLQAFMLLKEMQHEGVRPNSLTFSIALKVCTFVASLEWGRQVHAYAIESGFESDNFVRSILVDMYAKCGSIGDAQTVFDKMDGRDVVLWTAMITGYAQQGHFMRALEMFDQMQRDGLKPNDITFISILNACSHVGLVDEGFCHFISMSKDHGIMPTMEHYACMVGLLGRVGLLDEATDFIDRMPVQLNSVTWMSLLSDCRNHRRVGLGRLAFECVLWLDPNPSGAYSLLYQIYAVAGRWDEVAKIRNKMQNTGVKKELGCS